MSARYQPRKAYGGNPVIWDSLRRIGHGLNSPDWEDAQDLCKRWNEGALTIPEENTIAEHFLIAAAWASADEGTRPRATKAAHETAVVLAREFVHAIGTPLFRAALEAYESAGLHPDCDGEPCAAFGHDLFLTLEGHGVGFWDRKALERHHAGQPIGDTITDYCDASPWNYPFSSGRLQFYRGWIYFRRPTP